MRKANRTQPCQLISQGRAPGLHPLVSDVDVGLCTAFGQRTTQPCIGILRFVLRRVAQRLVSIDEKSAPIKYVGLWTKPSDPSQ